MGAVVGKARRFRWRKKKIPNDAPPKILKVFVDPLEDAEMKIEVPHHVGERSDATTEFGVSLLKLLSADRDNRNLLYSPTVVSIALALVYEGAREETKAQMERVLFPGLDDVAEIHSYWLQKLNESERHYELRCAVRMYLQTGTNVQDDFMKTLNKHYEGAYEEVDFKSRHEAVIEEINRWVEENTNDRIWDILSEADLNKWTRLLLVSGICFKARWARDFDEAYMSTFYCGDRSECETAMMKTRGLFGLISTNNYRVLRKDFAGKEFSMLFFLPRDRYGFKQMVAQLSGIAIETAIEATITVKRDVKVSLPRIKLDCTQELKTVLCRLGCSQLFKDEIGAQADFTGISNDQLGLYVSKIIHKAVIQVDEHGTEASAVKAHAKDHVVDLPYDVQNSHEFIVDHPFAFIIVDNNRKSVLFQGAVNVIQ